MIYLGILIVVFSTYLGYCFSKKLTKRKNFVGSFFNFNQKLKREVSFSKKSVVSLIEEETENDFTRLMKKAVFKEEYEKPSFLLKDDFDLFRNYAEFIGKSDALSQINYFTAITDSIKKTWDNAKEKEEKLRPLYLKLGFFAGLAVMVILL